MNGSFNAKRFKEQLVALLAHHHVSQLAGAPEVVVADFLDHCLQSFVRASQDRALFQAMQAQAAPQSDPQQAAEDSWLSELLGAHPDAESAPAPPAPRGPTTVKVSAPRVWELPAAADQATIDALSAQVNAAPSPVMVKFMLEGEAQADWPLNSTITLGEITYRVISIQPDKTLLLNRLPSMPNAGGEPQ